MTLPSSIQQSDELLCKIATLLFILVAGLLTVLGSYASSKDLTNQVYLLEQRARISSC
jgi:hypothetical protein